jgi:hypothetical protein
MVADASSCRRSDGAIDRGNLHEVDRAPVEALLIKRHSALGDARANPIGLGHLLQGVSDAKSMCLTDERAERERRAGQSFVGAARVDA